MANSGYDRALKLAMDELDTRGPEEITANTGVAWNGRTYEIPWLSQLVPLEDGSIEEKIVWIHYMLAKGPRAPRDRYIAYKQVPGAAIYNANFIKRCINPMVEAFQSDLDGFLQKGLLLGGKQVKLGHMAFTVNVLPYIPLTYILWQGDEEIPANGNILFDETAIEWLCAEDLVVIAGMPVYKMIKMPTGSAHLADKTLKV